MMAENAVLIDRTADDVGGAISLTLVQGQIEGGVVQAQGFVDLPTGLLLAAGTIAGAQVGAAIMRRIKPAALKLILGLYFLYVAAKFITAFFGIRIW